MLIAETAGEKATGTEVILTEDAASRASASSALPKVENINLGEVIPELQPPRVVVASSEAFWRTTLTSCWLIWTGSPPLEEPRVTLELPLLW